MILRVLILVLTLGNLGYYGWAEGWFDSFATPKSTGDREPHRIDLQVNPEAMRLTEASGMIGAPLAEPLPPVASRKPAVAGPSASASTSIAASTVIPISPAASVSGAASVPASAPTSPVLACVESGPYIGKDVSVAEASFKKAIPGGGWNNVVSEKAGVWMLYMGRFVDNETRKRKEGELSRRNAPFEEVEEPAEFARGLSLGRFQSRADADKGQVALNAMGVHTARIVVYSQPATLHTFRVDAADPATIDRLRNIGLPMPVTACGAASTR